MIILKSQRELQYMYEAGQIVARTLNELERSIEPGITTAELDRIAERFIIKNMAKPAFKGYNGYPATICASINEEVVHGIPSRSRRLKPGDIVSIDVGAVINGYVGDAARTYPVGEVDLEVRRLLATTKEALSKGIEKAIADNRLSDISNAVQVYVEANHFSVVRDFVGHGIGRNMNEDPQIPNFGPPGRGPRLKPGMALAIEPMVNMGTYEVETLTDNWTVITKDKKWSAHFEHTIAITEEGPWILTI